MKTKELRDLQSDELKQKKAELDEELFRLKIRHSSRQFDSTAALGKVNKDIARINTVLKQKEGR